VAGVTLAQVAALAGVSQPTASRVLNGSERKPSPAVVEAVRRAADELGYIPNAQAQALARATSGLLGLVVQDIADPYFSALAAGVQDAAEAHGRQVMLAVTLRRPEQELVAVQTFISHRADAIVLTGAKWLGSDATKTRRRLRQDLGRYVQAGGRAAFVGHPIDGAHAVVPQHRQGAHALATALSKGGAEHFVILGGPPRLSTAADRVKGFTEAIEEAGLGSPLVIASDFTRDGGFAAMREALPHLSRHASKATCVFAVTDVMALGAVAAAREAGLRVPDDVLVAGFDDIPTLRDLSPGLTTVRLPLTEMGRLAAELALDGQAAKYVRRRIFGEVVLRESTTPLLGDEAFN
jgi:LacI family transcriptional regulator